MSPAIHSDEVPGGILITDERGTIREVNRMLLEWLGYAEDELVGKRFTDFLPIGGKLYYETHHAVLLELQGEVRELAYELKDAGGVRHPVIVNARRRAAGDYCYLIFPHADRKKYEVELKLARRKAEEANRAQERFLSSMSHEIRNPLHAILEATQWLDAENPRPDQRQLIDTLGVSASNLLRMVNDLLDVGKLRAGKLALVNTPFLVREMLLQLDLLYAPLCRERGLEWKIIADYPPELRLEGDATRLGQVLQNLVGNATKFTPSGYVHVRVSGKERPGRKYALEICVEDSGPGIPADRQESVFEAFTQASPETYLHHGGSGLGLSIAREIAVAAGGSLSLVSPEGGGCTFTLGVTLPRLDEVAGGPPPLAPGRGGSSAPNPLAPAVAPGLRLLDVDDQAANLLVNARYFRRAGLEFEQTRSGKKALELATEHPFDVATLDLQMPDLNGYELAAALRAHPDPAVRALPLIAVTASQSEELTPDMAAAGFDAIVNKPFPPGEPLATIAAVTRRDFDETTLHEIFGDDDEDRREFLTLAYGDLEVLIEAVTSFAASPSDKGRQQTLRDRVHASTLVLATLGEDEILAGLREVATGTDTWRAGLLGRRLRRLVMGAATG